MKRESVRAVLSSTRKCIDASETYRLAFSLFFPRPKVNKRTGEKKSSSSSGKSCQVSFVIIISYIAAFRMLQLLSSPPRSFSFFLILEFRFRGAFSFLRSIRTEFHKLKSTCIGSELIKFNFFSRECFYETRAEELRKRKIRQSRKILDGKLN
jgi:hypothetical protein